MQSTPSTPSSPITVLDEPCKPQAPSSSTQGPNRAPPAKPIAYTHDPIDGIAIFLLPKCGLVMYGAGRIPHGLQTRFTKGLRTSGFIKLNSKWALLTSTYWVRQAAQVAIYKFLREEQLTATWTRGEVDAHLTQYTVERNSLGAFSPYYQQLLEDEFRQQLDAEFPDDITAVVVDAPPRSPTAAGSTSAPATPAATAATGIAAATPDELNSRSTPTATGESAAGGVQLPTPPGSPPAAPTSPSPATSPTNKKQPQCFKWVETKSGELDFD